MSDAKIDELIAVLREIRDALRQQAAWPHGLSCAPLPSPRVVEPEHGMHCACPLCIPVRYMDGGTSKPAGGGA